MAKQPETQWWVSWNGDQKGPLSTPQLKQWLKEGRINKNCFVRQGPDGPWKLLGKVRLETDWNKVVGNVVAVAGLALAIQAVLLLVAHPGAAKWSIAFLVLYVAAVLRICGPPKFLRSKKA